MPKHGDKIHLNDEFPTRDEFLDGKQMNVQYNLIKQNKPLLFMPTDVVEKNEKQCYKLYMFGILPDGSKTTIIIDDIQLDFAVRIPRRFEVATFKKYIADLCKNIHTNQGDNINIQYDIKEYYKGIRYSQIHKWIILRFRNLQERKLAFDLLSSAGMPEDKTKSLKLANNDTSSYYKKACRENDFTFGYWNLIKKYQVVENYIDTKYTFRVNRANIVSLRSKKIENLKDVINGFETLIEKDKSIVMTWDIETYSPDFGEVPNGELDNTRVFSICCTFHFVHLDIPFLQVAISSKECKTDPNWLTIQCSKQYEVIQSFLKIIYSIKPEFITGFNDGNYDWPFIIAKVRKGNDLITEMYEKLNVMPTYELDEKSIEMRHIKKEKIKLEAGGVDIQHTSFVGSGYVAFDTMIEYRKLSTYKTSPKWKLDFFLESEDLPRKIEMPYKTLYEWYRDYNKSEDSMNKIRQINEYCVNDAISCQRLSVKRDLISNARNFAEISCMTIRDSFYKAGGGKVRNYVFGFGFRERQTLYNTNQPEREGGSKYPGAYVIPPVRGVVREFIAVELGKEEAKDNISKVQKYMKSIFKLEKEKDEMLVKIQKDIWDLLNDKFKVNKKIFTMRQKPKRDLLKKSIEEFKATTTDEKIINLLEITNKLLVHMDKIDSEYDYLKKLNDFKIIYESDVLNNKKDEEKIKEKEKEKEKEIIQSLKKRYLNIKSNNRKQIMKFENFIVGWLYRPLYALDFSSLYPSLFMTYNLSPEKIVLTREKAQQLENDGNIMHHISFEYEGSNVEGWSIRHKNNRETMGIFSAILKDLFDRRKSIKVPWMNYKKKIEKMENDFTIEQLTNNEEYKEAVFQYRKLDSEQLAVKVLMNTFYGETGNAKSPLFLLVVAAGITTAGQANLKRVMACLEKNDYKVKYGDTDSVYVTPSNKEYSLEDLMYILHPIQGLKVEELQVENIKNYYIRIINSTFEIASDSQSKINTMLELDNGTKFLNMAYEEILLPADLNGKKKYHGIAHQEVANIQTDKIFEKGYKTRIASTMLRKILKEIQVIIFDVTGAKDMIEVVEEELDSVYTREWNPQDFILNCAYRSKKNNVAVHEFVRRLRDRGVDVREGDRLEYIVPRIYPYKYNARGNKIKLNAGEKYELASVVIDKKMPIDINYYIEKQVKTLLARLISYHSNFKVNGNDEENIMKLSTKYLTEYCKKYSQNYANKGKIYQQIYKKVYEQVNTKFERSGVDTSLLFKFNPEKKSIIEQIEDEAKMEASKASAGLKRYYDDIMGIVRPKSKDDREEIIEENKEENEEKDNIITKTNTLKYQTIMAKLIIQSYYNENKQRSSENNIYTLAGIYFGKNSYTDYESKLFNKSRKDLIGKLSEISELLNKVYLSRDECTQTFINKIRGLTNVDNLYLKPNEEIPTTDDILKKASIEHEMKHIDFKFTNDEIKSCIVAYSVHKELIEIYRRHLTTEEIVKEINKKRDIMSNILTLDFPKENSLSKFIQQMENK